MDFVKIGRVLEMIPTKVNSAIINISENIRAFRNIFIISVIASILIVSWVN